MVLVLNAQPVWLSQVSNAKLIRSMTRKGVRQTSDFSRRTLDLAVMVGRRSPVTGYHLYRRKQPALHLTVEPQERPWCGKPSLASDGRSSAWLTTARSTTNYDYFYLF